MIFQRYVGIDYSGAETPISSLKGLRVYTAQGKAPPAEVAPPPGPKKYWTRRGIAEWLEETLSEGPPALVGIDHGFSFPIQYFERHRLPLDWEAFLEDFCHYWPTHGYHVYVDFVRVGICGNAPVRLGDSRWRRLTEVRAGGAKSVFHFDVPGAVAKSTHAGLPWLLQLRRRVGHRTHFWPFDGWRIPSGRSVVAEVYPSLWSKEFPRVRPHLRSARCLLDRGVAAAGRSQRIARATIRSPLGTGRAKNSEHRRLDSRRHLKSRSQPCRHLTSIPRRRHGCLSATLQPPATPNSPRGRGMRYALSINAHDGLRLCGCAAFGSFCRFWYFAGFSGGLGLWLGDSAGVGGLNRGLFRTYWSEYGCFGCWGLFLRGFSGVLG